jgi:hypothetical protein
MSSLSCRLCGQPITFDNKHISQRTGKKIPLDIETNEPHDCPVRRDQPQQQQGQQPYQQQQTQQRRYYYKQCRKGCGQEIQRLTVKVFVIAYCRKAYHNTLNIQTDNNG